MQANSFGVRFSRTLSLEKPRKLVPARQEPSENKEGFCKYFTLNKAVISVAVNAEVEKLATWKKGLSRTSNDNGNRMAITWGSTGRATHSSCSSYGWLQMSFPVLKFQFWQPILKTTPPHFSICFSFIGNSKESYFSSHSILIYHFSVMYPCLEISGVYPSLSSSTLWIHGAWKKDTNLSFVMCIVCLDLTAPDVSKSHYWWKDSNAVSTKKLSCVWGEPFL